MSEIKICSECNTENVLTAVKCEQCGFRFKTRKSSQSSDSCSGTPEADSLEPEDRDSVFIECPACGGELASGGRCTRCNQSTGNGTIIAWNDDRVPHSIITSECPVFIGRVPPADDSLAAALEQFFPAVSRVHAEIFSDSGGVIRLRDLGSRNGTWLNGERLPAFSPVAVKPGDEIRCAESLRGTLANQ
jgi:ribosomal protein L40E